MTEKKQIEYVEKDWWRICDIKNPSETVQLAAVKADKWAIEYIHPALKTKLRHINYHWRDKWILK